MTPLAETSAPTRLRLCPPGEPYSPAHRPTLLLVHQNLEAAARISWRLTLAGYAVHCLAGSGLSIAEVVAHRPAAVLFLRPLPELVLLCSELREGPTPVGCPLLVLADDPAERAIWWAAGVDAYLTIGHDSDALEQQVAALVRRACAALAAAADAGVLALRELMGAYDRATAEHMARVGELAALLGRRMGLPEAELHWLYRGALLHDIGKTAVSKAVLNKPGPLTAEERARVRQHPLIGAQIVRLLPGGDGIAGTVRHHHERLDGGGYPDGLSGDAIPLGARITAVADAYDSLLMARPYQQPLAPAVAVGLLQRGAGSQWDPDVVQALAEHFQPLVLREQALGAP